MVNNFFGSFVLLQRTKNHIVFYSSLSSVVGQARRQHLQLQLLSEHHPVPSGTRRLVPVFEMKSLPQTRLFSSFSACCLPAVVLHDERIAVRTADITQNDYSKYALFMKFPKHLCDIKSVFHVRNLAAKRSKNLNPEKHDNRKCKFLLISIITIVVQIALQSKHLVGLHLP